MSINITLQVNFIILSHLKMNLKLFKTYFIKKIIVYQIYHIIQY